MKHVARALRLDPSTVSLALKGDARIKSSTREAVLACAQQLGYVPDPLLAALSQYRHAHCPKPVTGTLAFVCPLSMEEVKVRHAYFSTWEGARECALTQGYRLEFFRIEHHPERSRQLERIFRARGISGLIYAPILEAQGAPPLDWEQFSVIVIEGQHQHLPLHRISSDQTSITREAIGQLDRRGYRRIGLAVGSREEQALNHAFSSGYFTELALRPHLTALPPFYMAYPRGPFNPEFSSWVRQHRFDVILSNWDATKTALEQDGFRIPEKIATASLDLNPQEGANAGMKQNHRVVGARAFEQLAMLVKNYQRGRIHIPNTTLIPGTWMDGSDLPAREEWPGV